MIPPTNPSLTLPSSRQNKPISVQALTQFDLQPNAKAGTLALTYVGAFVAAPPGSSLEQLRWLDLPVTAKVEVTKEDLQAGRVMGMPFVGEVDLISDLDSTNLVMLETRQGFLVRGSVSVLVLSCFWAVAPVEKRSWTCIAPLHRSPAKRQCLITLPRCNLTNIDLSPSPTTPVLSTPTQKTRKSGGPLS